MLFIRFSRGNHFVVDRDVSGFDLSVFIGVDILSGTRVPPWLLVIGE